MTREQAKAKLIEFGIAEPTEEAVTKYLNSVSDETKAEKDRADKYKEDAEKAKDLQKQLDDIERQNLSDIEKVNQDLQKAQNKIAELEKERTLAEQRKTVVEKFKVTAEQADKIVKDDGSLDYDLISTIITEKETAAANAKEQELAKGADNPGGSPGGKKDDEPADVANVAGISFGNIGEDAQTARDYYK